MLLLRLRQQQQQQFILAMICLSMIVLILHFQYHDQLISINAIDSTLSKAINNEDAFIHIVFCIDHKLLAVASAAVNSTLMNTAHPEAIIVHLIVPISTEMPSENAIRNVFVNIIGAHDLRVHFTDLQRISMNMPIHFKDSGPGKEYLKNEMNYVRFHLPSILIDEDKIIYLDPDIIVQSDIAELWNIALPSKTDKYALAAVERQRTRHWWGNPTLGGMLNFLDTDISARFNASYHYFNAGVFVARLNMWRFQRLSEQMIEWMHINNERNIYRFGSQPPMNLVFYMKYQKLPPSWNVAPGTTKGGDLELKEGRKHDDDYIANASIIHWSGNRKPYLKSTALVSTGRYRSLWQHYYTNGDSIEAILRV